MFEEAYNELRNQRGENFGWTDIRDRQASYLNELDSELDGGHPLYERKRTAALARYRSGDAVLFSLEDDGYVVVYLTYLQKNTLGFPNYREFSDPRAALRYVENEFAPEPLDGAPPETYSGGFLAGVRPKIANMPESKLSRRYFAIAFLVYCLMLFGLFECFNRFIYVGIWGEGLFSLKMLPLYIGRVSYRGALPPVYINFPFLLWAGVYFACFLIPYIINKHFGRWVLAAIPVTVILFAAHVYAASANTNTLFGLYLIYAPLYTALLLHSLGLGLYTKFRASFLEFHN